MGPRREGQRVAEDDCLQTDGLPRRLRLLAMTGENEARAQTIDHICHCEAPKGPWQSLGSIVYLKFPVNSCIEIATSLRSSQ